MGLRDELRAFTEQASGFADTARGIKQEEAAAELRKRLPELAPRILGGDEAALGEFAAAASEAGDPSIMRRLAGQFGATAPEAASAQAGAGPTDVVSEELASSLGFPGAAGLPLSQGLRAIQLKQQQGAEGRRQETFTTNVIKSGVKSIDNDSFIKKRLEASQRSGGLLEQIKQQGFNSVIDRTSKSTLAKAIGGDAGNLAVQEVRELIPLTGFESVRTVQEFFTGEGRSRLTPELQRNITRTFQIAKDFEDFKAAERAAGLINTQAATSPRFIQNGRIQPAMEELANRFGLNVKVENGRIKASVPKFERPTELIREIEQLDPTRGAAIRARMKQEKVIPSRRNLIRLRDQLKRQSSNQAGATAGGL